ncbi:MAG: hypothetical protein AABO41_16855 [Acidobacteriota bacterium]
MIAKNKTMPRGAEFLGMVARVETQCGVESLSEIPKLGISTPACYEFLGDLLSMLSEEASCFHGCEGGDHFFQRLTARIVTNSLSSLRLAFLGYYDESLALTRNLGEMANLLFLFAAQPDLLETWLSADESKRKKDFSAYNVRIKIEKMNLRPPIDQSRYGLLCEVGVHIVPSVSPQTFNEHDRPTLGAKFQYEGLMCTLNELSLAVAESAACVSVFPHVGDRRESLQMAAQLLLSVVGSLDLSLTRRGGTTV